MIFNCNQIKITNVLLGAVRFQIHLLHWIMQKLILIKTCLSSILDIFANEKIFENGPC